MASSTANDDEMTPTQMRGWVLVVDDMPQNRILLGLYCEELGLAHEFAENGYEALDGARSGRFDLILMDILMPRMDGMTAARAIRGLPGPESQVPIIAVTTAAAPGEVQRYLSCGMTDVVAKPINRDRLREAIAGALGQAPTLPRVLRAPSPSAARA
jgi:CheY-like chemotaxis protein